MSGFGIRLGRILGAMPQGNFWLCLRLRKSQAESSLDSLPEQNSGREFAQGSLDNPLERRSDRKLARGALNTPLKRITQKKKISISAM